MNQPIAVSAFDAFAFAPGLKARGYIGDRCILISFDLDEKLTEGLAGFAIRCTPPDGASYFLKNRINFNSRVTFETPAFQSGDWTPTNLAPIQKFNWLHILDSDETGSYTYQITAMYFKEGTTLKGGASVSITLKRDQLEQPGFEMGFTRGYLSSQAYTDRFKNAPIRPEQKSIDYDTQPFEKQYEWLGFHARKLVFDFLNECLNDPQITLDVSAFDFDEPDIIRALIQLGPRLRLFLDNSALHVAPNALEPKAFKKITQSAGEENVRVGHFTRFAHNKIMIQKRAGKAVKVLTGSANFSVRGLYVQSNNILVFNDPSLASLYEEAFEESFTDMKGFKKASISSKWFKPKGKDIPQLLVAFSPHSSSEVSLERVAEAIRNAKSSVLFAIMELGGSGPVMNEIRKLNHRKLLTYGITQNESGSLNLFPPNSPHGIVVPFSYLNKNVPPPFDKEWSGGSGQVIHHKFIVIDFNSSHPIVFAGSSNLSGGGEEHNGDNLLEIDDPSTSKIYAVEAIRLIDHYHFRAKMSHATHTQPIALSKGDWWKPYYDPKNLSYSVRTVFAGTDLLGISQFTAPKKAA